VRAEPSDQEATLARGVFEIPKCFTIGFAAAVSPTYKRANLILRDVARLKRLLNNTDRPVQFVVAGKAHPHDQEGKELIRQLLQFRARSRSAPPAWVFIENYDMSVGPLPGCRAWTCG